MSRRVAPIDRILRNTRKEDDCVVWTGYKPPNATPQLMLLERNKYVGTINVRRYVWEYYNGKIPEGYHIRACRKNKWCVHQDHLRLVHKNQGRRFSDEQIEEMIGWHKLGYGCSVIALYFDTSKGYVSRVLRGLVRKKSGDRS